MSRNASNESAANITSSIQFFAKPYLAKKTKQKKKVFWEVQQFTKIGQPRRKKTTAFEHIDMPHLKYYGNPRPFPPVAFMMQHAE